MDLGTAYSEYISSYALPFIRIGGLLMVMPLIGTPVVGRQVRVILTMLMTLLVAPQVPVTEATQPGTLLWVLLAAKELLIGVALGLIVQMLFQALVVAGQTIAMQAGLGFAQLVDPVNGVSVAAISQLYLLMANIFFFSTNGHLAVFQVMVESFQQIPVGFDQWGRISLINQSMFQTVSWLFASGLLISLPVVIALLMVNLTFGVISKMAPQFNVFSFGFAFTVVVGILVVAISLSRIVPTFEVLTEQALDFMRGFYG